MRSINPAAKNANRAFVRLHTYVAKVQDWISSPSPTASYSTLTAVKT